MELQDIQLKETDRINTELMNQYFFRAYTDASGLFDQSFETLGKVELLNTGLRLIDNSNKRIIAQNSLRKPPEFDLIIDPQSQIIYPTGISDNEKADILDNYGIFLNKVIHKERIFTDLADQRIIKPGVLISKSSHNYIFLSKPEAVFESDLNDVLLGEYPYMLRFVGENIQEAHINIEASIINEIHTFNTLEYNPFPAGGLMELDAATVDDTAIANKSGEIPFIEANRFDRTFPAYIPFLPIRGNRLNLSILNQSRIESLNGSIVGVDLIEAFSTTYASTSYFGATFKVAADSKLKNIELHGTWALPEVKNVSIRIYDKEAEFNAVSDKYLINIDDIIKGSLNLEKDKTYYILFIMKSDDNFPQTISSVGINFG